MPDRSANCILIVVFDGYRQSMSLELPNLENESSVSTDNFDATEMGF